MFIMKKNVLTFISFLIGVTILLVACYEELDTERSKENVFMTYEEEVTAAREFYESMRDSKTRGVDVDFKTESGMIANMEPLWGKQFAYRRKNKKIRTVEAVMDGSKRVVFMLPEVREKYKQTKDSRYKQSMTRLVVTTDLDTGEKQAFTMTIMPDLDYLEKTNFKPFYNTYVQKDEDFSGVILFHELDGYFANGWRYANGKVTHSIEGTTFSKEEIDRCKAQTRATREECGWVDYYQLVEECKLWCYKNEFIEVCEEDYCYTYWEYVTSKWECRTVEVKESDGGYKPPVDTKKYGVPDRLASFFEKNEIGKGISKLDELFKDMLDKCRYSQMSTYMGENKFKMHGVRYNGNLPMGVNGGVTSGAYLEFRDESAIKSTTVEHEFFHMYQYAYGGPEYCTDVANRTAREFERQLFGDIALFIENRGGFDSEEDYTWGYNGFPSEEGQAYWDWLREITNGGTEFPDEVDVVGYQRCLSYYAQYNVASGIKAGYECNASNFEPDCVNYILGVMYVNCK